MEAWVHEWVQAKRGEGENNTTIDAGLYYSPEQVPTFTPGGLIALVSLLSAIVAMRLRSGKRKEK